VALYNTFARNADKVRAMNVQEQFVVDSKGKKTGVILSLKRYRKLMEDLHDLAVVAERRDEDPISLEEMKRRLKRDGIL
jgi:PHD/YefM family antitoxin component YafN of YafNO toxin-antitoxin module